MPGELFEIDSTKLLAFDVTLSILMTSSGTLILQQQKIPKNLQD